MGICSLLQSGKARLLMPVPIAYSSRLQKCTCSATPSVLTCPVSERLLNLHKAFSSKKMHRNVPFAALSISLRLPTMALAIAIMEAVALDAVSVTSVFATPCARNLLKVSLICRCGRVNPGMGVRLRDSFRKCLQQPRICFRHVSTCF